MNDSKKEQAVIDSLPDVDLHFTSFGERLRELRKEKGLSQDEFAKMLEDVAVVEKEAKFEGRSMIMFLTEKK